MIKIKSLTLKAKKFVQNNDLENFILNINEYWDLKKNFNPHVTNNKIDQLILKARKLENFNLEIVFQI